MPAGFQVRPVALPHRAAKRPTLTTGDPAEALHAAPQAAQADSDRTPPMRWQARPRRASGLIVAGVLLAGAVTATACRADSRSAQRPQPPSTTTPPVSVTFAAATPSGRPADTAQLASTTRVLQARLDAAGIRGGTISVASGTVRVTVPAAHWRQQVAVLLAAPGRFELRPVLARAAATDPRRAFAAVDCTTTPPVAPPDKQTVVCLQPRGQTAAPPMPTPSTGRTRSHHQQPDRGRGPAVA
jgi:hypothetical protein